MSKIFQFQDSNGLFEENNTLTTHIFIIKNKLNSQCNKYDKKILFNYLIFNFYYILHKFIKLYLTMIFN